MGGQKLLTLSVTSVRGLPREKSSPIETAIKGPEMCRNRAKRA